ncbi:MAG: sirohydrochlorin chelatase [Candidatus Omnitrophota bacterium]
MKKALIVLAHGSRSPAAAREVRSLARAIGRRCGFAIVRHAFLRTAKPDFAEAVAACVKRKAEEITVAVHLLNAGRHTLRDIPALVRRARGKYNGICFKVLPALGLSRDLVFVYRKMIRRQKRGGRSRPRKIRKGEAS